MAKRAPKSGNWSAKVARESFALELAPGVFTWHDPKNIAQSLKHSADSSSRRKSPPFQSAMSMLVNRPGKRGGSIILVKWSPYEEIKQIFP